MHRMITYTYNTPLYYNRYLGPVHLHFVRDGGGAHADVGHKAGAGARAGGPGNEELKGGTEQFFFTLLSEASAIARAQVRVATTRPPPRPLSRLRSGPQSDPVKFGQQVKF
jgi:hypothetical protein